MNKLFFINNTIMINNKHIEPLLERALDNISTIVEHNSEICSICTELLEHSNIRKLTCSSRSTYAGDHIFHEECLIKWIVDKNARKCPLCRTEIGIFHYFRNQIDRVLFLRQIIINNEKHEEFIEIFQSGDQNFKYKVFYPNVSEETYDSNLFLECLLYKNDILFDFILNLNYPEKLCFYEEFDRPYDMPLNYLGLSIKLNYDDMAYKLVSKGADVNMGSYASLFLALSNANYTMYNFLIDQGADIHRISINGENLLHYISVYDENITNYLITHLDINNLGLYNRTPLMDIIIYVEDPIELRILVELYIKNGANIYRLDQNNKTAMHYSIIYHRDCFDLLAKDPVFEDDGNLDLGDTTLILALKYGQDLTENIISHLIKIGVNINLANNRGIRPLMYACELCNYKIIELLIKNGADLNMLDNNNMSILDYLIQGYRDLNYEIKDVIDIINLLLDNNVNINLINENRLIHFIGELFDLELIVRIINLGANIDELTIDSKNIIYIICENGGPIDLCHELIMNYGATIVQTNLKPNYPFEFKGYEELMGYVFITV
jgi:ankyrin repeat protein